MPVVELKCVKKCYDYVSDLTDLAKSDCQNLVSRMGDKRSEQVKYNEDHNVTTEFHYFGGKC